MYFVRVLVTAAAVAVLVFGTALLIAAAMPPMPFCSSVDRYWTDDGWHTVPIGNDGHGPGVWNCVAE